MMLAHPTPQHEPSGVVDFDPDMVVVQDIDVSDPANAGRVSRFSDDSWCLSPAARKTTAHGRVCFGSSPPRSSAMR